MYRMCVDKRKTGERIREEMDRNGMFVKGLAESLDVSAQAVWKYLNGRSVPTVVHLYMIAKMFGVDMSDLVVFAEKRYPEENKSHV